MSNGTQYSVEPVQVEATDHLPHYGPSNTWEDFLSKQSPWMQQLLEEVHFLSEIHHRMLYVKNVKRTTDYYQYQMVW